MKPHELLAPAIPSLTWTLLAAGLGCVGAAVVGVAWIQGRRVPGVVGAAPVGLPAAVALGVALTTQSASVQVGQRLIAPMLVGAPLAILLLLGGIAAARKPPRRLWAGAVAAAVAIAVGGIIVFDGISLDDATFATFRACVFAAVGLMAAVSAVGTDDAEGAGPEVGAAVGIATALFIATGEAGARALAEFIATVGASTIDVALRQATIEKFVELVIGPMLPWSYAAVAVASLSGLIGMSAAGRDVKRLLIAGSALVWLGLAGALLTTGAPEPTALVAATNAPP